MSHSTRMSDIGKPLTTVELEVVEGASESDNEGNEKRPSEQNKYRRNKTTSAKSHTKSCSSLCSFAPSFKSDKIGQRSEPNVNYHADSQTGDIVDLHLNLNALPRQSNENENDANTDASSDSPKDGADAQTGVYSSNGLRESLINVLGKLGMWKNNSKLSRVPQGQWDSSLPSDKKPSQPTTSKYFRAFSFVGNFWLRHKTFFFTI